jgi:hypothetical protein
VAAACAHNCVTVASREKPTGGGDAKCGLMLPHDFLYESFLHAYAHHMCSMCILFASFEPGVASYVVKIVGLHLRVAVG